MAESASPPGSGTSRVNPMKGRVVATGDTPASAGNIANIVTVIRILLAPVFIWLLLLDDGRDGWVRYAAAVLFVVAILTDSVDGILARGRNLVTDLGKILDPIADKILVGAALVSLSILGELWWWVTIVILVREIGITVYRFIALRDRVIAASMLGKVKTWFQSIAVAGLLFPFDRIVGEWYLIVMWVIMGVAVALTVVSGVEYLVQAYHAGRAKRVELPE